MPSGEMSNAYEVVKKLAKIGSHTEAVDVLLRTPNVGVKPRVLYTRENGVLQVGGLEQHGRYPTAPIGRVRKEEPGVLRKGALVEDPLRFGTGGPKVHHAKVISTAEGAMDGIVYPHPAHAVGDAYDAMFERARLAAIGQTIQETATRYGIRITTLEDLIASKATTALHNNLDGVVATLGKAIGPYNARARRATTAPAAPVMPDAGPPLPRDLRGAKPRWRNFQLEFERARLAAIGQTIQETATRYGIRITTLEDLIASKATTALHNNLDGVVATLGKAIGPYNARARHLYWNSA